MRYRLRTLMIVLAVLPPLLAVLSIPLLRMIEISRRSEEPPLEHYGVGPTNVETPDLDAVRE